MVPAESCRSHVHAAQLTPQTRGAQERLPHCRSEREAGHLVGLKRDA